MPYNTLLTRLPSMESIRNISIIYCSAQKLRRVAVTTGCDIDPEGMAKVKIFISYASEDALIANALETAFTSLTADGFVNLEVYRDVHTFQQGRPIKGQIIEQLRDSDILFVIYSKVLKRSHSYTGFEVGAFSVMMDSETKAGIKSARRIVSLFFDEPPATEQDVLGIQLNLEALRPKSKHANKSLGLSGDFTKFLGEIADTIIDRQFPARADDETAEHYTDRKRKAKEAKRETIKSTIIPKMDAELRVALASSVARFTIEQKFIQLRWESQRSAGTVLGLTDDVIVVADKADVLETFGFENIGEQTTWADLKEYVRGEKSEVISYFIDALEYVVHSALSAMPIDNDEIVMAADGRLYRVIVTRHYAYFDGGRTMHVYFIPMIEEKLSGPAFRALALLRLATRFRMMFLVKSAPLSPEAFVLNQDNEERFKSKVQEFTRETLFTAGQSHANKLDDPQNFVEFFSDDVRPSDRDIAALYKNWKSETQKVLTLAGSIEKTKNMDAFIKEWHSGLRLYIDFVTPINARIGAQSAERLQSWFETSAKAAGKKGVKKAAKKGKNKDARATKK